LDEEMIIGPLNLIPIGEGRRFEVRGTAVAIFHTRAGQVFATQADCPHQGGPLADGLVGGSTLICPLHERAFDLITGAGIGQSCTLRTYPVRITQDGAIGLRMHPPIGLLHRA
jgi:nitrite reductase (NADH) small subunit